VADLAYIILEWLVWTTLDLIAEWGVFLGIIAIAAVVLKIQLDRDLRS
jgi:hypothetical protein